MTKKTLQLIKNNPVIIMSYVAYMVISLLFIFFLYPNNLGSDSYMRDGVLDYSLYLATMRNLLIALLLIFILSLLFLSGYCNMIKEAVLNGKTKLSHFVVGIKNYFPRVLLCMLLMLAIIILGAVLFGILSVAFTILASTTVSLSLFTLTLIIMLVTLLLVLIPSPFLVLWLPALFLENTGVIRSLSLGARAGAKSYWRLLLATLILILPQAVYSILNYNVITEGTIFSIGYFIMLGIMAVISLIYNTYIFMLYHEYSSRLVTIQR